MAWYKKGLVIHLVTSAFLLASLILAVTT